MVETNGQCSRLFSGCLSCVGRRTPDWPGNVTQVIVQEVKEEKNEVEEDGQINYANNGIECE